MCDIGHVACSACSNGLIDILTVSVRSSGGAVLSSWHAEQEVLGSIPGLAATIRDMAERSLKPILKTTNQTKRNVSLIK